MSIIRVEAPAAKFVNWDHVLERFGDCPVVIEVTVRPAPVVETRRGGDRP